MKELTPSWWEQMDKHSRFLNPEEEKAEMFNLFSYILLAS